MRRAATALLLLLFAAAAGAAIEVIELRHRSAEALLPTLQTVAGEDVSLAADGGRLIVRGPAPAIAELKGVIQRLDVPAASLAVTLRRRSATSDAASGLGAGGRGVEITSTERGRDVRAERTVRTLAGHTARLETGRRLPVREWIAGVDADGAVYGERLRYTDAPDRLFVTPRLQGDQVTVEVAIDRLDARRADDSADRRQVVTTVSGPLGEWLPIATIDRRRDSDDRTLTRSTRRRSDVLERLELKIERVR